MINDNGWMQHIVHIADNQPNFSADTYPTFTAAKKALKKSFQQIIKDYRWTLKNLKTIKKSDVLL